MPGILVDGLLEELEGQVCLVGVDDLGAGCRGRGGGERFDAGAAQRSGRERDLMLIGEQVAKAGSA